MSTSGWTCAELLGDVLTVDNNPVSGRRRVDMDGFVSKADFDVCKRLHRRHGTTYYFATLRLPQPIRDRVHALYGFLRVPDEWVDNPIPGSEGSRVERLRAYRDEFLRGMDGVCPTDPVLRAFCKVAHDVALSVQEPMRFLDAMEIDLFKCRYETYTDLREYMLGSAVSVGWMMCDVMEVERGPVVQRAANALGEAMQLTNFLRDVGEDMLRGRIYLPAEDLARFSVTEESIRRKEVSARFIRLMEFEIERARELYRQADEGIALLPGRVQDAVKLSRILYSRILDRIEDRRYDVFTGRARTSKTEKLATAFRVISGAV